MNKVLRAAIRTMSRHQGDMTKDYEKSRKKKKCIRITRKKLQYDGSHSSS